MALKTTRQKGNAETGEKKDPPKTRGEKPPVERLIRKLEEMGATHGLNEMFVTFLELSAASLGAQLDPVNAAEREKEYGELAAGLSREDLGAYAVMLALLCMAVREQMNDPVDILGDIFHRLGLSNKWNGQFFTPSYICRFMAEITGIADSAAALGTGHLKINEPSCGSGAMVIGAVG